MEALQAYKQCPFNFDVFTLFLALSTSVGIALLSNCLSELGRQLLPAYCHFIRSNEITRDNLVSFWQPGNARSKDWKYSLSPAVQNEKFTIYPVHVLQHRHCKSQAYKLDFQQHGTELTRLSPRFQKDYRVCGKTLFLSNCFVRSIEKKLVSFLRHTYLSCTDFQYWN